MCTFFTSSLQSFFTYSQYVYAQIAIPIRRIAQVQLADVEIFDAVNEHLGLHSIPCAPYERSYEQYDRLYLVYLRDFGENLAKTLNFYVTYQIVYGQFVRHPRSRIKPAPIAGGCHAGAASRKCAPTC